MMASRVAKAFTPAFIKEDLGQPKLAKALEILADRYGVAGYLRLPRMFAEHPTDHFVSTVLKGHADEIETVFKLIPQSARGLALVSAA